MKREYKCEYEYILDGKLEQADLSFIVCDNTQLNSVIKNLSESEDKQLVSLKLIKVRDIND